MGNQLAGIAPSQIFPVEHYLTDLPDIHYDCNLGSTRFFKVARARHKEGWIVVKVFAIHDPSLPLRTHRDRLEEIRSLMTCIPNCLPFQKSILTDKAAILMRQYVKDNLYDRISTRPFLNSMEKHWIAFQLLNAVNNCHKLGVCHGDIKLENIMVTGWNWVLLTDFASFKPTYLPEDNPADFSYFFDTSRRRTCYIAPERFVKTLNSDVVQSNTVSNLVLPEEEIKKGDLNAAMDIFSLGCALTELFTEGHVPFDFSQLLSYRSGEYSPWKVIEKIEDPCIRDLVRHMMQKDPNKRSAAEEYLEQQRGKAFPEYFYSFLREYVQGFASVPILTPDERIARLKPDIKKILEALTDSAKDKNDRVNDGLVIIVSLVTSCLRALKHCTAKLHALEVLKQMAELLSSEVILDRLLPYMLFLVNDRYPQVRVAAIKTMTYCLTLVKIVPRSDANIFPEYILRNVAHMAQDEAVMVRMAYAENIAVLAETALRFLEKVQLDEETLNVSSETSTIQSHHNQASYDTELQALHELVQQSVSTLLSDPENAVKQMLLEKGITQLCVFFGQQKANDVLLSHMITFLNDKEDRHLRAAFFDSIIGVAAYIGWHCSPILKPLLQQGLADTEEFVISKTLTAMTDLAELGLLQKQMCYELIQETVPLLCHPNLWLRQGTVGFVCAVARTLNLADVHCKLAPLLQPFLQQQIIQVDQEVVLLDAVKTPLSRVMFDYLVKLPNLPMLLESLRDRQVLRSIIRSGHQLAYGDMDEGLKSVYRRLQSDGLTEVIEDKILSMKDHLLKIHKAKSSLVDSRMSLSKEKDGVIDLTAYNNIAYNCHSVDLGVLEPGVDVQQLSQNRKTGKKKELNVDSPLTMNEEWQHMFGTTDSRGLSPAKQDPSDIALSTSNKQDQASSGNTAPTCVPVHQNFDSSPHGASSAPCAGRISPVPHEIASLTYQCVPCKQELNLLIKKKQDESAREHLITEASENIGKEDVSPPHKWHPQGTLVAHLHEHRGAVNRLQIIPNTSLFATCSNDGTVKIWDGGRMIQGRNVANRSRQTYSRMDGQVISLASCQNLQSLAAATDSGSIHVFRIEHNNPKTSVLTTRTLDTAEEGCAVDMHHFDTGSQSILSYATVYGSIVGWDLRFPGTAWRIENDLRLGLITSYCVDPHNCWLVVGTSSGNLVCWDLRFQLPITTVNHPTGARVRRLLLHPQQQSSVFCAVRGNNEVSLWDLETGARQLTLWASNAPPLSQTQATNHAMFGMYLSPVESGSFLLTAGSDMRIRYWDLNYPADSYIVAGAANDPLSPTVVSYRSRLIDGTEVIQEMYTRPRTSSTDDPPRRCPEMPPAGHHDCISDLGIFQTSQCFLVSAARDGVVKLWK